MEKQITKYMEIIEVIAEILRNPDSKEQKAKHMIAIQRIKTILDSIDSMTAEQQAFRAKLNEPMSAREFVLCIFDLSSETLQELADRTGDILK